MAPTLGDMDISLSLSITINLSGLKCPALFRASKAMPAVMAPSPITATTYLSWSPIRSRAFLKPRAADMEVELWPAPKASKGLSSLLKKPDMPPNCLRVGNVSFLSVRIFQGYA